MGDQFVTDNEFEDLMLSVYMDLPGAEVEVYCPAKTDCFVNVKQSILHYCSDIPEVIIHLNDDHKWSREQIADWVDSLEEYVDLTFKEKRHATAEDCTRE